MAANRLVILKPKGPPPADVIAHRIYVDNTPIGAWRWINDAWEWHEEGSDTDTSGEFSATYVFPTTEGASE